ncbi:methylmalonyl-CoA mutase family protein [Ornithinimicrobium sp. Y1847]|uniref:methylmalonyl-CoA mutase family protein n=1 Tax=Ornithinimicrobium sp. Y1847 TaxID=3405419 RepID=UPI003B66DA0C
MAESETGTLPAEAENIPDEVAAPDHLALASVFPAATHEQWESAVLKVLNRGRPGGRELDIDAALARLRTTTVDGLQIEPLHVPDGRPLGYPGVMPFDRGATLRTGEMDAWDVRQLHEDPDPHLAREAVRTDLERGATSIWVRTGSDAVDPADLEEVLADVLLDLAPIVVSSREDQVAAAHALLQVWRNRADQSTGTIAGGNLGLDALAHAALTGTDPREALRAQRELVAAVRAEYPQVRALTVDALPWHDAGATDVDEIGLAVAAGVSHLRDLEDAGISPTDAAAQLEFRVSATADQFLTIARLRALRRVWARIGEACGIPPEHRGARQHAVTSWRMLSRDDAYVNVLRTTTACFAAAAGGAESITVMPFDTVHGLPNAFSRRLARNVQIVLAEESNIGRVNDPAGGSAYVEDLTDQVATRAWAWFQQIEAAGGLTEVLASGSSLITDRLAASTAERDRRLSDRSAPITGVSMFPQLVEPPIERRPRPAAPASALPRRRDTEPFEELRDRSAASESAHGTPPTVVLAALGSRRDHGARETFTSSLLAVAGIHTRAVEVGATGDESDDLDVTPVLDALRETGSPVAILCSSPARYAASHHGTRLARALREGGASQVLVAGQPSELTQPDGEDLNTPVVDGHLAAGMDTLPFLRSLLDTLEAAR